MRLQDLTRDPSLVPTVLNKHQRGIRGGFIKVRVRILRKDATDPANIPDSDIFALVSQLSEEITQAEAAYETIRAKVKEDELATDPAKKLYNLTKIDDRVKKRYRRMKLGSPNKIRTMLVESCVWWAVANHNSLLNPTKIDDLNLLVDRRLRSVERMLYDVGAGGYREWDVPSVITNPGGDWSDGWNRMFEYPRVPKRAGKSSKRRRIFNQVSENPAMSQWGDPSYQHIYLVDTLTTPGRAMPIRLNSSAQPFWKPDSTLYLETDSETGEEKTEYYDYCFIVKDINKPVDAIEKLFEPRSSYKDRNLLFCDHVIHALNMEALLWAKKKRSDDTSWLRSYVTSPDKLRIDVPFGWESRQFLAGYKDGKYFEGLTVHVKTVQIGDHVIVYNHPAYDKVNYGGVWRLENAIVVRVYPTILYQGHGTKPLSIGNMKRKMIGLFNRALNRLRHKIISHIQNPAHETEFDIPGGYKIVLRVAPETSSYTAVNQKADWWVRWPHDREKGEQAIATDPDRKALAKAIHEIEFDATYSYFPLWEPQLNSKGKPKINAKGKILKIQPVKITPEMVAAWTWYTPKSVQPRSNTPIIRPAI